MDDELDAFSISQQQQELMAAQTLESDLDLAFRIQLQEALSASLLPSQPSSSSSSSSSSSHLPHRPSFPATVSLETDSKDIDDISVAMRLQTLELDRFHQERRDRDLSEAERRRIALDLTRRAHDRGFASEIQRMADEDWDEYGDEFEKPIGGGACSSSSSPPFRLYFKGLVCEEEVVKGKPISLAAIGVAVCDPWGTVVVQKPKPLSGVGMSRAFVETKALIEGLQEVVSMGIKVVDVYCDYVPLYNQVTGKWAVKQKKIINLMSQVYPLQRKLEKCQMHLLPRCHVQFVFKLARQAIDSQISRTVETYDKNLKETCTICLEDTDVSQVFVVGGCLHRYCFSCMKQHVEVKLLHGVLPGCPKDGCTTKLNVDSSRKFLSPRLIEIMAQRIKEAAIPETDRLYCPYPKCSALMSRQEMMRPQEESSSTNQADYKSGLRKCVKCKGFFCLNCKVPWHANMSCSNYRKFNPHFRAEDAKLQSLARQKLWRQCVKCKHMIELAEGCYHMTCRCGFEFCYTCGAEWINKKATCSCPLWDEENIWHDHDEDDYDSDEYYDDEDDYDSDEDEYDEPPPRRFF